MKNEKRIEQKSNRKNIVITDENYDAEFEKICDANGYLYGTKSQFVTNLPDGFHQVNKDEDCTYDFYKSTILPNFAVDCVSAIENYCMAYEFKNGFMIIGEKSSFWD